MREEALCADAPSPPVTPGLGARAEEAAALEAAEVACDPAAVLELLEPDQLVSAKRVPFGRRSLSPVLRVVLWGLRAYVVFMLVVVVIEVVRSLPG